MLWSIERTVRSVNPLIAMCVIGIGVLSAAKSHAAVNLRVVDSGGPSASVGMTGVRIDGSSVHQVKDDATQLEGRGGAAQALVFRWDDTSTQLAFRRAELKSRATWDRGNNLVHSSSGNATLEVLGVSLPRTDASACGDDALSRCLATTTGKSAKMPIATVTQNFYGFDVEFELAVSTSLGAWASGKATRVLSNCGGNGWFCADAQAQAGLGGGLKVHLDHSVGLTEDVIDAGIGAEFTMLSWTNTADGGGWFTHRSRRDLWVYDNNKAVSTIASGGGRFTVFACILGIGCLDHELYNWPSRASTTTTYYDRSDIIMYNLPDRSAW